MLIGGRLGPGEAVVMRMYGRLALHAESVVLPLLAADAPVVTWWHAAPPDQLATDALAVIADRRITDSSIADDPMAALRTRAAGLRPRRHRPGLDPQPPRGGRPSPRRLDSVAGRRGEPVHVRGGPIEGDPAQRDRPAARRLALRPVRLPGRRRAGRRARPGPAGSTPWSCSSTRTRRCECTPTAAAARSISQPFRPDTTVALPERALGDLLGEELRRLDPDEPYRDALEAATGVGGLADRSPTREHVWFDPAEAERQRRQRRRGGPAKATAPASRHRRRPRPRPKAATSAAKSTGSPNRCTCRGQAARRPPTDPPAGWKVVEK